MRIGLARCGSLRDTREERRAPLLSQQFANLDGATRFVDRIAGQKALGIRDDFDSDPYEARQRCAEPSQSSSRRQTVRSQFHSCRFVARMVERERDAMQAQLASITKGYEDFSEFDDNELQLIEALRSLRLLRFSGWIARRWHDPAFPAAFPWFNTQRYWQDRVLELREQISAMQEPGLRISA